MGAIFDRIKEWWQSADRTQKLVTVFGAAFLVVILGLTVMFASQPKMQPVLTGLSDQDRSAVYDELTKGGFKVEITPQMEVVVPSSEVPKARMYLASKNKLPKSGGNSFQMIESIGLGDSQRKENEKIIAAKEQELSDSIMTMEGVAHAQVHLTLGKDSAFGDQTTPPTAAVRITEANDNALSSEAAKAIARLVQNSVTGLKADGVTVVTNNGRMIYDGEESGSSTTIASKKMEAEAAESKRRAADLQRELDQVFGIGNTIVQVDVQLNMDATTIAKDETIRTGDPIVEETSGEKMTSNGGGTVQGAGTESNIPGQPAAVDTDAKSSDYESEQKSKQYPTSNTRTNIERAAGELIAMNVSVMANSVAVKDLAPLEERVANYIAPWQGDEKFTSNVTAAEFSDAATKLQEKAAADAASAARMQQIISILPIAALLGVAFILIRSLAKQLKPVSTQTVVLSNGQTIQIPINADPQLLALIETSTNLSPSTQIEVSDEEIDLGEELVDTGEIDENGDPIMIQRPKRKKKKRLHDDDDDDDDDLDIESIKRKVDIPLEQLRKMSKKNPEAVAMLLKSWMMEEQR